MTTKQFGVMLALVVIAGFLGGAVAELVFHATPAFAQGRTEVAQQLTAQSFVLVDKSGRTQAVLGLDNGGPNLYIYTANGKRGALIGLQSNGFPNLILYNPAGGAMVVNLRGLIEEANPQPSP